MSQEIRAGHKCPHLVIEEPVPLGSDRQSLITKAPIAASDSIFILANDTDYIPPEGLYSVASLSSNSPGPYQIQKCVGAAGTGPDGNLFTISSSAGTVSIRLDVGDRIPVAQLEKQIRLTTTIVIPSSPNGVLTLTDAGGPSLDSFVRVSGIGSDQLKFVQKGARGRILYPGWVLDFRRDVNPVIGPRNLIPVPARYPKFVSPLRGNPTLKVTYVAVPARCPRCNGTSVENDYRFDMQGDMVLIQNENLLLQVCLKAILTVQGSNPYHPGYGSKVTTRVGNKALGASSMLIREDIQNALKRVQDLQRGQSKYQLVTDKERLYSIRDVQVTRDPNDPTVFRAQVTVQNGSNKPVVVDIVYSTSGVVALAGTNGQTLGLEPTGLTAAQSRNFLR